MESRSRLIAALLACLVGAALIVAAPPVLTPADAATTGAGFPGITPYGGFLGNYIAPDGSRVYCIDANLDWPSGATGAGTVTGSLASSWGSQFGPDTLQKFNYALARYGQTADPVQAAAMSAYLYAYTSGYARTHGPSFDAGLHYINGNSTVAASFAAIWADAETLFASAPTPSAELSIEMTEPLSGTVQVTTSPEGAEGTLTLEGAVIADTNQTTIPVTGGEVISIEGAPGDGATTYTIAANATFRADTGYGPEVTMYLTGSQQRTIRDAGPARVDFASTAQVDVELPAPPPTPVPEVPTLAATGSAPGGMLGAGLALVAVGLLAPIVRRSREYGSRHRVIPSRD